MRMHNMYMYFLWTLATCKGGPVKSRGTRQEWNTRKLPYCKNTAERKRQEHYLISTAHTISILNCVMQQICSWNEPLYLFGGSKALGVVCYKKANEEIQLLNIYTCTTQSLNIKLKYTHLWVLKPHGTLFGKWGDRTATFSSSSAWHRSVIVVCSNIVRSLSLAQTSRTVESTVKFVSSLSFFYRFCHMLLCLKAEGMLLFIADFAAVFHKYMYFNELGSGCQLDFQECTGQKGYLVATEFFFVKYPWV